jgi:hypothetical protein
MKVNAMKVHFTMTSTLFYFCAGLVSLNSIDAYGANSVTPFKARTYTAMRSGPISDISTFGFVVQDGDILNAGPHTVTIDRPFTAGVLDTPQGYSVLIGEFIIEAGMTLTVNGDWNAGQSRTQNILKQGAHVEFNGTSGTTRVYKTVAKHYTAPSIVVKSSQQDKAFFGLKPGSKASFIYDRQGFLGANIYGGNIHLNGFSTGYIHHVYDRSTTNRCKMPNVLMTNSGRFELRYLAGKNGSCDMRNLTILSPVDKKQSAFRTAGNAVKLVRGARFNLNGLSVDGTAEYYARSEFYMNDWVLRGLEATTPNHGWQNINEWLLFNADTLPASSAQISNVYFRSNKYNPHGFTFSAAALTGKPIRKTDSVIFDFVNLSADESGDMYIINGPGANNEILQINNNIALKNLNGHQSSTFVTYNSSEQNGRQLVLENNVVYIPHFNRAISLNEASTTPAYSISSVRSNIFWGDDKRKGYVIDSVGKHSLEDILAQGAYVNNGVYQARDDGLFGSLDLPLSYTPNDAVFTGDPQFHDDSRRLETYGKAILDLDGQANDTFIAFVVRHLSPNDIAQLKLLGGHQTHVANYRGVLSITTMINWIKRGFKSNNTNYQANGIGLK